MHFSHGCSLLPVSLLGGGGQRQSVEVTKGSLGSPLGHRLVGVVLGEEAEA